jgi:tellurite resistance protein TehA-like permease
VANLTPNWFASVMGTGIAATGALLIPYAPAGQVRLCLLLCCYAMFGITLIGPSAPSARTYRSA